MGDLAAPLPMIVIGDMLGVPPSDRDDLLRWSHGMLASLTGEPEGYEAAAAAFGEYVEYAHRMIAARRAEPTDDLFSVLVHARGRRRAARRDDDIVFESLLLLIGGDETTRQVTAGGMEQLLQHPDQRRALLADRPLLPVAVEEMLRWVSPIKNMARTTTRDVELEGVDHPARGQGRPALRVGQLRRRVTSPTRALRHRADAERPPGVRLRAALLPRREPGAGRAADDVRPAAATACLTSSWRRASR